MAAESAHVMVITEKLIFLELQKTACTYIERLLIQMFDGKRAAAKKHIRLESDPAGKMLLGSVRNPWDWYASLWSYGCMDRGGIHYRLSNPMPILKDIKVHAQHVGDHHSLWRLFKLVYRQTFKPNKHYAELYRDHRDPKLFREWLRVVLDPTNDLYMNPIYALGFTSKTLGLFSFRYLWLFSRNIDRLIKGPEFTQYPEICEYFAKQNQMGALVRTENLEDDLLKALATAGYNLDNEITAKIKQSINTKTNKSNRLHSAELYDQETAELVSQRDRLIIDLHDYSAPVLK